MAFTSPGFSRIIEQFAADEVEQAFIRVRTPLFEAPTDDTKRLAREFREKLVREGKVFEFLEAITPPSPEEIAAKTEDLLRKIVDLSGVRECLNPTTLKEVDELLGTGYAS